MTTIYKSEAAKAEILALYDAKLKACNIPYTDGYVDTFAGKTHIVITGDAGLPPLVLLHGINAGAPLALEAIKDLNTKYRIYAVDIIGQATKSAETRLPINDNSIGKWLVEVLDALKLQKVPFVSVSYGAFVLQKLMLFQADRIEKAIFIVPSGLVNGGAFDNMVKLMLPLMKFNFTKNEADLVRFMNAFYTTKDKHSIALQKAVLLGVKMDYRKPPVLGEKDVAHVKAPVYVMVADNDVFFPGLETLEKCKRIFPNFKEGVVIKGCKHIPDIEEYPFISGQIEKWMEEGK